MNQNPTRQYTPAELKTAYQIVQADLFNSLTKLKSGENIHFGNLGKFTKKEAKIRSALFKEKLGSRNTFVYYRLNFKPFRKLKTLFTEQIIKKYKLKF